MAMGDDIGLRISRMVTALNDDEWDAFIEALAKVVRLTALATNRDMSSWKRVENDHS